MRFAHILAEVHHKPWLITADGHAAIVRLLESRLANQRADSDWDDFIPPLPKFEIDESGIALIPLVGVLGRGLAPIEKSCGNTDLAEFESQCAQAAARAAGALVYVDSPGGMVNGTMEAAAALAALAAQIPVYTFTPSLMASAAYWVGSQATQVFAAPSAMVGSIGVIIPWVDAELAWAARGYVADPITNAEGDLKATFYRPSLTDAEREHLEAAVQETFDEFQMAVLLARGDVPADLMRGQCVSARAALAGRLIDGISSQPEVYRALLAAAGIG
jgi:ClpP class serine protease